MAASPQWLEAGEGQCRGHPSARNQTNNLRKAINEAFGPVIPLRITTPALANDTSEDAIPLRITSPPVVGRHDIIDEAPCPLAEHIMSLPYKMAIQGTDNASEALRVLRGKPMQREPARRSNKKWAGNLIHQHIDASISNVESAVLQIVGPPPVKPCRCCRNRHGPWARCIVSPEGCGNIISACANCHWYDKDKNCNFYKAPAPAPAPMNQPGKSWEKGHRHASSPFQGRLQHQERLTTIGMAAPRIMEHLHAAMADQRQEEAETRITVKIMETIINDPALDADERYIDLFRLFPLKMGHTRLSSVLGDICDEVARLLAMTDS